MFFKKEKNCKMHCDLEELQHLTITLKQAEKEYNELKKEINNNIKPFKNYSATNVLSYTTIELLSIELTHYLLWGGNYRCSSPKGFFEELKPFLPEGREREYLKDLGKFFIACAEEESGEILSKKEKEIEDLKKQIKEKKEKLGIC